MNFKDKFEDYTESEFLEFLQNIFSSHENLSSDEFESFVRAHVQHFEKVSEHPDQSDVIFYPKPGQEDSPQGVLKVVKEWRAANGKPGFKPDKK
jgi:hypothetical protein